jgi:CDP-glucose 4,6-dehydratase
MVDEIKGSFKNKRVFITGHTGFKGAWLTYWLHSIGAIVKGYSLAPRTEPNLYSQLKLDNKITSVIGDINDLDLLSNELSSFEPDFVFHLAAQPLVRRSYKQPIYTFQTNVIGTANLLEAFRCLDKPCVCVCITTDKVYENNEWIFPYRENDRLGGYDPYSASKGCSELVISSFSRSFFDVNTYNEHNKSIASARAGNVIGGGDWSEDRIIPDIVRALSRKQDVILRNPSAIRPWQHVMEPLFGYMKLALSLGNDVTKFSGAWNFGPSTDDTLSVIHLSSKAIEIWGEGHISFSVNSECPHEAKLLKLDISKAIGELNWTPKMKAEQAIQLSIEWYKKFYNGTDAVDLVENDLNFYNTLLN